MQNQRAVLVEIATLRSAAVHATQTGKDNDAGRLWVRILDLDPNDELALISLGKRAFKHRDMPSARAAFERLLAAYPHHLQGWINLALTGQGLKDETLEQAAIDGALRTDPSDLIALILRANLLERQGQRHRAASVYGAVASVAPPLDQLDPGLHDAVSHALQYRTQYNDDFGTFIDGFLAPHYRTLNGENLQRFRESVDIMVERKRRYDSQSMMFHYPGLLPTPFFERSEFPWLDAMEAGTDAIREELLAVLAREKGITPYMAYPDDVPHNQFAKLNNSPRWSAYHLISEGMPVPGNTEHCPETMRLLAGAPQPDQPGRTPSAMFSLLKPHTRIPPHVGVSNVRVVAHLPLIVPGNCGLRVANETRSWELGKAFVFDDTIEHEAWNDSDKLRVVLIFDVWHPHLRLAERAMITALTSGINAFRGSSGGFDL